MRFRLFRLLPAVVALAATAALPAPSAHASITVQFGLSAGRHLPTGAACPVTVNAGDDGIDVLEAAVQAHCIVSYDKVTYAGVGTFITCIDEVCGQALTGSLGTYWNMYVNGASTSYGVDGYSAVAGDELSFAYKPWCFMSTCPPDLDQV